MKDIPVFTGTHGVATLVLKQIPWSGCGYVIVRSVWTEAAAFLEECLGFCRACGAEQVYASWGCEDLPAPHGYDMLYMCREKAGLPKGNNLKLEVLSRENGEEFLAVYNRCFRQIPNAASYGREDLKRLLGEDTAWLLRQGEACAAIGEISTEGLEAVAVLPEYRGLGYDLTLALLEMVPSKTLRLKVASTNQRALALYDRLGFERGQTISRWWKLQ